MRVAALARARASFQQWLKRTNGGNTRTSLAIPSLVMKQCWYAVRLSSSHAKTYMIRVTLIVIITSSEDSFFALLYLSQRADESADLVEGNKTSFVQIHWIGVVRAQRVLHGSL
jgi:hypothetical protein